MSYSTEVDQSSNIASEVPTVGAESVVAVESRAPSTSSSTIADQAMAKKQIPNMYEYWKVPTVTDKDIANFHDVGWLLGVFLCTPTTLDFPTINRTHIVYFESHLMCGLGLPPSKFLVSVLNYLGCKLVHLHLNTFAVLNCFSMLCECWICIPPDTTLFWYFYYLARYEHKVFFYLGQTLCHNHRDDYPKALSGAIGRALPKGGSILIWPMRPNGQTSTSFCH
jgi:hypothetical protein